MFAGYCYTTQVVSYTKCITKDLLILNCFRGKAATVLAGIFFHLDEDFPSINFTLIGMLSSKTIVSDFEGFLQRKEKYIVEEFGVCTEDYVDCVSFLSPTSYSELTTH